MTGHVARTLALALALAAHAVHADEGTARIDRLAATLIPLCHAAPAPDCVEAAFAAVDVDASDRLETAELEALDRQFTAWYGARREQLVPEERIAIGVGIAVVDAVGVSTIVDAYDTNGDGALDRREVTADVRLDERPLPQAFAAGDLVDWDGLRNRLGALVGALIPQTE